jgi:hypothetical protein
MLRDFYIPPEPCQCAAEGLSPLIFSPRHAKGSGMIGLAQSLLQLEGEPYGNTAFRASRFGTGAPLVS